MDEYHTHYILYDTEARPIDDVIAWGQWFATADRQVAETLLEPEIRISTVFLGLNHQFGDGPPLLYETMVFGGPCDGDQTRYSTWHAAELGHEAMVAQVQSVLADNEQKFL